MKQSKFFRYLFAPLGLLLLLVASAALFSEYNSPNTSNVNQALVVDSWPAVQDQHHNAFTDLVYWQDSFLLVFRQASSHADLNSRLVVMKSPDAKNWSELAEPSLQGEDLRDPKFAVIGRRLFLYALKNKSFPVKPYSTIYSVSADGKTWSDWQEINPQGWLFWRPKSNDQINWFVPAYRSDHTRTALFHTQDGIHWDLISPIYHGAAHSETDVEFMDDQSLLAVIRLDDMNDPPASTVIGVSKPPYTGWSFSGVHGIRLDGPDLFRYNGKVYALGRFEPQVNPLLHDHGGILNKKRTAIFQVEPGSLRFLSELPSGGDTSYPGAAFANGFLYVSYYTNDIHRDFSWLVGQFNPTQVRIAKINLQVLESLSK